MSSEKEKIRFTGKIESKEKRTPEVFQPEDFNLLRVATYATQIGVTAVRVYKMFQEGKINIVTIDGIQFVQSRIVSN